MIFWENTLSQWFTAGATVFFFPHLFLPPGVSVHVCECFVCGLTSVTWLHECRYVKCRLYFMCLKSPSSKRWCEWGEVNNDGDNYYHNYTCWVMTTYLNEQGLVSGNLTSWSCLFSDLFDSWLSEQLLHLFQLYKTDWTAPFFFQANTMLLKTSKQEGNFFKLISLGNKFLNVCLNLVRKQTWEVAEMKTLQLCCVLGERSRAEEHHQQQAAGTTEEANV